MEVGDLGTMGFFIDPCGAFVGEWQFGTCKGFGVPDVPGAPAWFELHSRDYAAVLTGGAHVLPAGVWLDDADDG